MRPIALHTSSCMGFQQGDAACVELIHQARRLLISSTVLDELLAGFACGDREAGYREELRRFPDHRQLPGARRRAVQTDVGLQQPAVASGSRGRRWRIGMNQRISSRVAS